MTTEDLFNGAKTAFTFYDAYFNTVAQELGTERALALHTRMCETMGAAQGQAAKQQAGVEAFDAQTAFPVLNAVPESIGIHSEVVEQSPQRVMIRPGRCSIYEAAQALGLDHETIETLCRAGPIRFMDAMAKQLNPNLSYRLVRYRSGPDDCCEEEIVLE